MAYSALVNEKPSRTFSENIKTNPANRANEIDNPGDIGKAEADLETSLRREITSKIEKAKFDSGVDKVKESDVQYIYDPASIQKQYSIFDFKPTAPARAKEAPKTGKIPPGQRVRVHTTGDVRASGTVISE